jgi:hypothetical protein
MCELRKRGIAAAVICSEPFLGLAQTQARVFGVPDLQIIVIPHPLGGLDLEGVKARADVAAPQAVRLIKDLLE